MLMCNVKGDGISKELATLKWVRLRLRVRLRVRVRVRVRTLM